MNLYFHSFRTGAFSGGKSYKPFKQRYSDKPMMVASIFAGDLEACHKAGPRYQFLTGTEDIGEVWWLVKPDRYHVGMMTPEDSDIGLPWVLAISRREMKFIWHEHVAGETLGNTVENIEGVIQYREPVGILLIGTLLWPTLLATNDWHHF